MSELTEISSGSVVMCYGVQVVERYHLLGVVNEHCICGFQCDVCLHYSGNGQCCQSVMVCV